MRPPASGVLAAALRPAGGGGVLRRPQMASPLSPSRRKQQAQSLSRSALKARNALVLEHLPLADAIASVMARRLFPLVEREDLIQVAREALVRSAPRCRAGEPAEPYLRRCITGALQHHLRDRVRLVPEAKQKFGPHSAGSAPPSPGGGCPPAGSRPALHPPCSGRGASRPQRCGAGNGPQHAAQRRHRWALPIAALSPRSPLQQAWR